MALVLRISDRRQGKHICSQPRLPSSQQQSECRDASQVLDHQFAKSVMSNGRPIGCFWDSNGGLYFNTWTDASAQGNVWGGVGPVCKRRGAPLLMVGGITSPYAKHTQNGEAFGSDVWITQETAKKQSDIFILDNGACPINRQIWLHKENDGSEDMAGRCTLLSSQFTTFITTT